jgi:hypothetical protein
VITENHNSLCREANLFYYDSLSQESSEQIPEHIRAHIEKCANCRRRIQDLKAALSQKQPERQDGRQNTGAVTEMLELHFAYIDKPVTCETVRPFLPGLLDPSIEITIPTPITVHLDNCPYCAEDLKEIANLNLDGTQLYGLSRFFIEGPSRDNAEFAQIAPPVAAMAARADSEVITIYHTDESAKQRQPGQAQDLYSGFPIRVEVINRKAGDEQPVSAIDFAAFRDKISALNLKPLLTTGFAVAAVLLLGFALLLNTTSAEADVAARISRAVAGVRNAYVSKFNAGEDKLMEEQWISQDLNMHMVKNIKGFSVFDVSDARMKVKDPDTGAVITSPLTEDQKTAVHRRIHASLGLTPLQSISNLPAGSKWNRREDLEEDEGIQIHDLTWTDPTSHSSVLRRWRFFVDSKSFLPKRIEVFRKSVGGGQYDKINVIRIRPLSTAEIRKAVQDAGFQTS